MSYKITITRTENVQSEEDGNWVVIETRPLTDKEMLSTMDNIERFGGEQYQKDRLKELRQEKKEVRGYAPKRTVIKQVEEKVFEQVVETIDLAAVICAANNMEAVKQL